MNLITVLVLICVFLIELLVFYWPLYLVSYLGLKLDRKIGDKKLATILISIAIVLSVFFLNKALDLTILIFFKP